MIIFIILLISIILDNTISYYFIYLPQVFLYLKTLFFISFILIYMIFFYKKKNTLYFVLVISIIYDLLFESIYLLNGLIFSLVYLIIYFMKSKFYNSKTNDVLIFILSLIMYIVFKYLILILVNNDYSIMLLINEIINSLVLNIIYGLVIYYFFGINSRKT